MATESAWRLLVRSVHAELDTILEAENRALPELFFGRKAWTDLENPAIRCVWIQAGGRFTKSVDPTVPPANPGDPPAPLLGVRVAFSEVRIFHTSDEMCEHVLDRLWMATDRVAASQFVWTDAAYGYPTEEVGTRLKNGISLITLTLPTWVPVAREFDGEVELVTVADTQIRTGIENPEGELEADTRYEVDDWTVPKTVSEP
jgi:hypothetical protein